MLNSESIVIIRIKEEHLLYSNISGNVCYIVNFPRGNIYYIVKYQTFRGKVCYAEGLLCDTGTIITENENICIKERVFFRDDYIFSFISNYRSPKCSPVHTTKSLKIPKGNSKLYIKEGQTIQWPKEKGQTMIYKTLCRKLKIEQHEPC